MAKLSKARWDKISEIMGIWPDASIAKLYGVDRHVVGKERAKRKIAAYPQECYLLYGNEATKAKGQGTQTDVLACLWPTQPSTSGEVHERMVRSHGQITHRHVIRVLRALVKSGKVKTTQVNGIVGYVLGAP